MDVSNIFEVMSTRDFDKGTEKEILNKITQRVIELMDENVDLLMGYLYRLDINELKLKIIMQHSSGHKVAEDIAGLIWARQKQRLKTKEKYKKEK